MLYKTIKLISAYVKGDTEYLSSWLFFMLGKIKSNLSMAESSSQFKKLREILTDYNIKYKKELFVYDHVEADYDKMQRMLVNLVTDLDYGSKERDLERSMAIEYIKFLYDLNEMLHQAISK